MSIAPETLVLLDTSVLVHLVRNDATGKSIEGQYALSSRPERPLVSSITEGEIFGLAYFRRWARPKLLALHELLDNLVRVEVGLPAIVESYAQLYAEARRKGVRCGQNDLWIAAAAKSLGAVLLTCDEDFNWLDPSHVRVRGICTER